jgi:glycosyltransferase involved in cell wall biosynthesis
LLTFNFDAEKYEEIVGEEFPKEVIIHSLAERVEVKPPFTIYKRRNAFVKLMKKFRDQLNYDYLFSTQSSSPFEPVFLKKAKKNIAYVHFPEVHFSYDHSSSKRKAYLWLFKKWVEQGINKLDLVLCNSNYTKENIERYWSNSGVKTPVVVYPPVNLANLWCDKPLPERQRKVVYVARFISTKRHELMKRLATELPNYEFVSIGGLTEAEREWFSQFSQNLPPNYSLKTNLPDTDLIQTLQDSRVYVHLMEGEHFGIAPIEAVASGCATLVHNSGGMKEFIPDEFRWQTYEDLKMKIIQFMESTESWENKRRELWDKIAPLNPETFQDNIWWHVQKLIQQSS